MVFTKHESRNTKLGFCSRCVRRGCPRGATPERAVRTAAPAARSRLPCPRWPAMNTGYPADVRRIPDPAEKSLLACSLLSPGVRHGSGVGMSRCPRTVRVSRSVSRRALFAADPVSLRARSAASNAIGTRAEKGKRPIAYEPHKQGSFPYCVVSPAAAVDREPGGVYGVSNLS